MDTVVPAAPEANLPELIDEWKEWMRGTRGLLPNTIKLYARSVEIAMGEIPDLPRASTEVIEAWVLAKGGKESTYSNRVAALASFFRFLVRTKRRSDNPTTDMDRPKRRQGVPKPVDDLEAALVELDRWDAIASERGPHPRRIGETRDMAVFIAETGFRISEACSVHIDGPAPAEITIIGKGAKEAIVLLTPKAREAIDRLGGEIGIGTRAVQRRFERALFHPHMLRHWRATSLVRAGTEIGTVSKIMRHSSPAITMTYAQYATSQMRAALESVV